MNKTINGFFALLIAIADLVIYADFESMLLLGRSLFKCLALALDLPETYFDDKITKPIAQLRILHHPPQSGAVDPKHLGVGAHTES